METPHVSTDIANAVGKSISAIQCIIGAIANQPAIDRIKLAQDLELYAQLLEKRDQSSSIGAEIIRSTIDYVKTPPRE